MAILFDLDGTLLDTGPDIHKSVNILLEQENKAPVEYSLVRSLISYGGARIVEAAFNLDIKNNPEHELYLQQLMPVFFEIHTQNDAKLTKPFPGISTLLVDLENMNLPWGIVTNKTKVLTEPLLTRTGYLNNSACIVCGDTTSYLKPHPASLNYACELLKVRPKDCVYIGDAETDIQAGKAAGMQTIAAGFGYVPPHSSTDAWQADHVVKDASEILPWIRQWLKKIN